MAKKADIYICLGDPSNLGEGLDEAGEILAPLKEKLLIMPGNHETSKQIEALCKKHGFLDFHQRVTKKGDFSFAGLGLVVPTPFDTPGETTEEEFEKALRSFRDSKNLLLFTHCPPKNSQLDLLENGSHVGSQAVQNFIKQHSPLYCFCGHIHENHGKVQRIGETTCFSIGKKGLELWL